MAATWRQTTSASLATSADRQPAGRVSRAKLLPIDKGIVRFAPDLVKGIF
jgi:hypothetical protein